MRVLRPLLLAVSVLALAPALLQAQAKQPNILGDLGRRHRLLERQRLQPGDDGLQDAQHRSDRRGGRAVHRLVRPAELHRGPLGASSPASPASARACSRSDCPARRKGLQARDVTIAELLKAQGYVTGQFGKNHLGDRDEHLPTAHGFDEFFGLLYHLNAEEEPEHPDYFKDPELRKKFATRGILHCWANPDGTQKIELTGPLTKKRMETCDEEFTREDRCAS